MPVDDRNLDNAISRLVVRFGEQAVRASLDRISGKRRGRPKIDDWEVLADLLEQDAHAIVTGGTPTSSRKSIARDFAIQRRGQSEASTIRRIERKLAQNREHYASVFAYVESKFAAPYSRHLEIIEELSSQKRSTGYWLSKLTHCREVLARYQDAYGNPDPQSTMAEIEAILLKNFPLQCW